MKRKSLLVTVLCMVAVLFFASCNDKGSKQFPGFKQTKDGLYYQFHHQDMSAKAPQMTDFLKVQMLCYLHDSLFYDWAETDGVAMIQLAEPHFPGDLQAAYAMMHEGDSASFYIKADSIADRYYGQNPDSVGISAEDYFRYDIKLLEIKSEEEFKEEVAEINAARAEKSREQLATYVEENGITVKPTESGIYILPLEKGKGRCPVKGEKVEVDYDVYTLKGDLVGSSSKSEEVFSFVLGEGYVIKGWEEVLPMMHLGEKVRAIIPFDMAYGEHSVFGMPPFTNLVYDIKLNKIITVEEQQRIAKEQNARMKADSEASLERFVKENGFEKRTASGLYYKFEKENNGKVPSKGSVVKMKFNAKVLDGQELGSSEQHGGSYEITFGETQVLAGFGEGVGLMTIGDKATFVLPYYLAYGANPYNNIPAFSNIIFDIEVLDIVEPEKN